MCAAFPRNNLPQKRWTYPTGPHLGVVAPGPWPQGPAAVAAPAGFLKDVRTPLTGLAGHDEVDAPFAGLGDKTQALALGASFPSIQAPALPKCVSFTFSMEKSGF